MGARALASPFLAEDIAHVANQSEKLEAVMMKNRIIWLAILLAFVVSIQVCFTAALVTATV